MTVYLTSSKLCHPTENWGLAEWKWRACDYTHFKHLSFLKLLSTTGLLRKNCQSNKDAKWKQMFFLPKVLSGMALDIRVCFLSNCTSWLSCPPPQPPACFLGPSGYTGSNRAWPPQPSFPASPEDRGRPGALSLNSASEPPAPPLPLQAPQNGPESHAWQANRGWWHFILRLSSSFPSGEGRPDGKGLGNTRSPLSVHDPLP